MKRLQLENKHVLKRSYDLFELLFLLGLLGFVLIIHFLMQTDNASAKVVMPVNRIPSMDSIENFRMFSIKNMDFIEDDSIKADSAYLATFLEDVEKPAWPVGGIATVLKNIEYPSIAIKTSVERTVLVQAYIDTNGVVRKAKVLQGIGAGCDEDALQAVYASKFYPGKQFGETVNSVVNIPVVFGIM